MNRILCTLSGLRVERLNGVHVDPYRDVPGIYGPDPCDRRHGGWLSDVCGLLFGLGVVALMTAWLVVLPVLGIVWLGERMHDHPKSAQCVQAAENE